MPLVIVSNPLVFTVAFKEGSAEFKSSASGLTTGLWSYLEPVARWSRRLRSTANRNQPPVGEKWGQNSSEFFWASGTTPSPNHHY